MLWVILVLGAAAMAYAVLRKDPAGVRSWSNGRLTADSNKGLLTFRLGVFSEKSFPLREVTGLVLSRSGLLSTQIDVYVNGVRSGQVVDAALSEKELAECLSHIRGLTGGTP